MLPIIGTKREFFANTDLLAQTRKLPVASIPPIPQPTKRDGNLRANSLHYMDLNPVSNVVTIRSDPVRVEALGGKWTKDDLSGAMGLAKRGGIRFGQFWEACSQIRRNAFGVVVLQ